MTRQLFFAITLIGTGVILNAPAQAVSPLRCEDQASNCVGRCANYTGGAGDFGGHQNLCMRACDRRVIQCLIRAR